MNPIHPTAIVSDDVVMGEHVKIAANTIIEEQVTIGDNTIIGPNVIIKANTSLGNNNRIFAGVILGEEPQDISQTNVDSQLLIGDNNVFREYVTINRGSSKQARKTIVGHNNMLMAYSHIGHDVVLGNQIILTNHSSIGGHAIIGDNAIIGACCAVHQFCQVGAYAMLSRGALINKDVLPYMMVCDNKPKVYGLNLVGLKRNGFSKHDIRLLRQAYNIIFESTFTIKDVINALKPLQSSCSAIHVLIDAISNSHRGIVR